MRASPEWAIHMAPNSYTTSNEESLPMMTEQKVADRQKDVDPRRVMISEGVEDSQNGVHMSRKKQLQHSFA
jgi:hypothetical protein